jgi:hypothetical protein
MTERPSPAVDLHSFALREFLQFVRKEDPRWIDGAQVRRSDDDYQKAVSVWPPHLDAGTDVAIGLF